MTISPSTTGLHSELPTHHRYQVRVRIDRLLVAPFQKDKGVINVPPVVEPSCRLVIALGPFVYVDAQVSHPPALRSLLDRSSGGQILSKYSATTRTSLDSRSLIVIALVV